MRQKNNERLREMLLVVFSVCEKRFELSINIYGEIVEAEECGVVHAPRAGVA